MLSVFCEIPVAVPHYNNRYAVTIDRMAGISALDQAARKALEASFLSAFPADALDELLADAIRLDIPAGGVPYRESDLPRAGLVVSGLVRVYMTSREGRQVTVRYARPGEMLGVPALVGGPVPVNVQAVTDATLLALSTRTLIKLAKKNASIAWALAQETSERLYALLEELAGNTFSTVRERTARHLLDLAAERQHDRALIVPATQQEIADAVGSVREVVARALHQLAVEGLVKTTSEGIVILDPAGLHAVAWRKDL